MRSRAGDSRAVWTNQRPGSDGGDKWVEGTGGDWRRYPHVVASAAQEGENSVQQVHIFGSERSLRSADVVFLSVGLWVGLWVLIML